MRTNEAISMRYPVLILLILTVSTIALSTVRNMFIGVYKALLFSTLLSIARAEEDDLVGHYEAPDEQNVVNVPSLCFTNGEGFGGTLTEDFFTVTYYYEMEYMEGGAPQEQIISSFETDTTNFILQSDLFDLPCSQVITRQGMNPAQGISANPGDEPLEGVECSEIDVAANGSTDCVVVSGAFQVYYTDDGSSTDLMEAEFKKKIEEGINAGQVTFSHPDLREVVAVPEPSGTAGPGDSVVTPDEITSDPDDNGNSTPVIIGATVGALLVIGAAALYRRRKQENNDETAFTPDPATEV
jgi:hypothetical protein